MAVTIKPSGKLEQTAKNQVNSEIGLSNESFVSESAQEIIEQLTEAIVTKFQPKKIILFGSYAYGQPTIDSDVDLLLLMETDQKPIHVAAQVAASIPHPLPLDIMVWTPTYFTKALARQAVFATEIMTKGKVLYETGDPRMGE